MSKNHSHHNTNHKSSICKIPLLLVLFCLTFFLGACRPGTDEDTKLRDLEFTVLSEEALPEELKPLIAERSMAPFQMTYSDKDYLYICVGYGEQKTGGYSIAVNDLYLTDADIHIQTALLGPDAGDTLTNSPSYPYIVVKTKYLDKTVIFE